MSNNNPTGSANQTAGVPEASSEVVTTAPSQGHIRFAAAAYESMARDARERFPLECVGFLFGTQDQTETLVLSAEPTPNVHPDDQRRRFAVDPLAYMRAEKKALLEDKTLVGIYHSHPNYLAIPSVHDHAQALPSWSYPILSVHPNGIDHIRSWRLNGDDVFQEETIVAESIK